METKHLNVPAGVLHISSSRALQQSSHKTLITNHLQLKSMSGMFEYYTNASFCILYFLMAKSGSGVMGIMPVMLVWFATCYKYGYAYVNWRFSLEQLSWI